MENNFLNMRMLSYELYDIFKMGKAQATFLHEICRKIIKQISLSKYIYSEV